jgi:predicted HD phosphohydrolase
MGRTAVKFFEDVDSAFGLTGKMRFAFLAKITSTEAATLEDTPELLRRLEDAYAKLKSENDKREQAAPSEALRPTTNADPTKVLRRHLSTYVELMAQRDSYLGDLRGACRRITETASSTLDIERVSIWFLDDQHSKITCEDLYVRATKEHVAGTELFARDFPAYFRAVKTERTIAAHDAHTDPRTSCFSKVYLTPLNIGAMLDVPIWHRGKMLGVVCHEHVGSQRRWNSDEETFAYLMSNFAALAVDRAKG